MVKRYALESSAMATARTDGTYRIRIINAGEGSSGVYPRELFTQEEADKFAGLASFLNHPIDPGKPHLRPVESIAGRLVGDVSVEEHEGEVGFYSDFKPRSEYKSFFEEFADVLGMSIFMSAQGDVMEDGRIAVESFARDAYSSVDVVVAAGRGGRFERATESLRVIESSLGLAEGNKPGATAAPGEKESNMDLKELVSAVEALAKTLEPVVAFVAEQKAAADAAVAEAEAKATAATEEKDAAIESYAAAVQAVSEAKLLPSQESDILTAAKAGKDVTPLIESAKKVAVEAQEAVAGKLPGFVISESAAGGSTSKITDWSF
ncbi:hypothetical protein [Microbacterium sp. zg-YB36]|uniref:hypothetical protein n=1 Tax=Microbacterium sp. zg-YB36 TaxID=2969407 RepID=UPI00214BFE23|nr:hypothetical protein [Microbacterium sp. zg-YB36]MDL5351208.1 hypothetical protein [Microbacterium sp. zg-YB36]